MPAVGNSVARKDGIGKATGGAKYADDLTFPGMLLAGIPSINEFINFVTFDVCIEHLPFIVVFNIFQQYFLLNE